MILLEGAKATTETVDALRTGASAMKAMQKATYVVYCFILSYLHLQDLALIICLTLHFLNLLSQIL